MTNKTRSTWDDLLLVGKREDALPRKEEMVTTFAIAGTPEEARERVEDLWRTADSLTLAAPFYSLDMGKIAAYQKAVADTFYQG